MVFDLAVQNEFFVLPQSQVALHLAKLNFDEDFKQHLAFEEFADIKFLINFGSA